MLAPVYPRRPLNEIALTCSSCVICGGLREKCGAARIGAADGRTLVCMTEILVPGPGNSCGACSPLAAWVLFSWDAANFGSGNKTYGSVGAAMGWLRDLVWLSSMVILLGAEPDAEMRQQTPRDTTPPAPAGTPGSRDSK
jgi:hypothetical protein